MAAVYATQLYRRLKQHLDRVKMIDCHEHLPPGRQPPKKETITIGRLFGHYASCDLISAGMPPEDLERFRNGANGLTPKQRWKLLAPWYKRAWNTGYCEALRIAIRDLYDVEEFTDKSVGPLTAAMQKQVKPGFIRKVFDQAGIDFAMNDARNTPVFDPSWPADCFLPDMRDTFTNLEIEALRRHSGLPIRTLNEFLQVIEWYFDRYGKAAGAFKVGRAYNRTLRFEDVPQSAVEGTFNRLLAFNDRPDQRDIQALEDFILHHLCRVCGDYGIRMKFHAGLQEGNGNLVTNSRAALLANLFMKYPKTQFDIYHISYPYEEELATLAKNFTNVTIDFCWVWIINPEAGRRALRDMLDTVPANKIHGFGGDYIFVEGSYGHAAMARREIARVLAAKVEEGRFSEAYAAEAGTRLLRTNALENFDLRKRRAAYKCLAQKPRPRRGT